MFCPNCGKDNLPGAVFCIDCGARLQPAPNPQPAPGPPPRGGPPPGVGRGPV